MSSYKQALDEARSELSSLMKQRADLDDRIARLNHSIAGLAALCDETDYVAAIAAGNTVEEGLSDAIRGIVRSSVMPIAAPAIRDQLVVEGFDPDRYANFLTVVHNTLRRLEKQGEVRMVRNPFFPMGWTAVKTLEPPPGRQYGATSSLATALQKPTAPPAISKAPPPITPVRGGGYKK
jgi:hypothetical protein